MGYGFNNQWDRWGGSGGSWGPFLSLIGGLAALVGAWFLVDFLFVDKDGRPHIDVVWATTGRELVESTRGDPIDLYCPANGPRYPVWGTATYSMSSSVCAAAVHDSAIDSRVGGTVIIVVDQQLTDFVGSESHGVTSQSGPREPTGFRFSEY